MGKLYRETSKEMVAHSRRKKLITSRVYSRTRHPVRRVSGSKDKKGGKAPFREVREDYREYARGAPMLIPELGKRKKLYMQ